MELRGLMKEYNLVGSEGLLFLNLENLDAVIDRTEFHILNPILIQNFLSNVKNVTTYEMIQPKFYVCLGVVRRNSQLEFDMKKLVITFLRATNQKFVCNSCVQLLSRLASSFFVVVQEIFMKKKKEMSFFNVIVKKRGICLDLGFRIWDELRSKTVSFPIFLPIVPRLLFFCLFIAD